MLNLDPSIFNPNIFWEAWKTTQNFSQTMFNFFDMLAKNQKVNPSQNSTGALIKEYIAYVSYNANMANKLFMTLSSIRNSEDLLKLQESILLEYSEQNLNHLKKILSIYQELFQENYENSKQHAEELFNKYHKTSGEIAEKFNHNMQKFTETMNQSGKSNNSASANNVNKKSSTNNHEK